MVAIAFQSAMADAADEHEHLFGTRRESLYYGGPLPISRRRRRTGSASSSPCASLDLIGFPTNIAANGGAGVHIDPAVLQRFGLLYGPGAGAIATVALLVFLFYRLDRRRHAEIQADLEARRAATLETLDAATLIERC